MKKKLYIFLNLMIFTSILSSCSSQSDTNNTSGTSQLDDKSKDSGLAAGDGIYETKGSLAINHRCTGCNRCAMIDSEHFSRSFGRSAPKILSQENLESSRLQAAVERCPVNAIVLNS